MKEKTLREHMSEIAIKRHKDLKKKLGIKGYKLMMSKVGKGEKLTLSVSSVVSEVIHT